MEDDQIELPPGFRFHPTDEELITHYLSPKVLDSEFDAIAIAMVDLNKVEPWDLPWRAKMGEKEWYFFCMRDRKYPTGLRTNRATDAGYWKATGKDKEIYRAKSLVGMKKTLVFYKGRAPKGEKSNWVMHEYRLEGKNSINYLPKSSKNEWVICRIFHKSADGKKIPISGLERFTIHGNNKLPNSNLPPLFDLSPFDGKIIAGAASHVTCFSDPTVDVKPHDNSFDKNFHNNNNCNDGTPLSSSSSVSAQGSFFTTPFLPYSENYEYSGPIWMQDPSLLRLLIENNNHNNEKCFKEELGQDQELEQRSYEDDEYPYYSNGAVDLDCLWNY